MVPILVEQLVLKFVIWILFNFGLIARKMNWFVAVAHNVRSKGHKIHMDIILGPQSLSCQA